MDFPTRNLYRSAIEELARGSDRTEIDVAAARVAGGGERARQAASAMEGRQRDPGYSPDRAAAAPPSRPRSAFGRRSRPGSGDLSRALGIGGYVGAIAVVAAVVCSPRRCSRSRGVGLHGAWLACSLARR